MPKTVLVERPAVDWITLTTFDDSESERMLKAFYAVGDGEPKAAKQAHYKGVKRDGLFLGVGEEENSKTKLIEKNTILRAWGSVAQDVQEWLSTKPITNCTRLDLQVTVPLPHGYSARRLKDGLQDARWEGRKRNPFLREGVDGLDTVEIGSRTSNRFVRIYVKLIENAQWLRFEVEYKREKANQVHREVNGGNLHTKARLLLGEVDSLPELAEEGIYCTRSTLNRCLSTGHRGERLKVDNSTMAWLIRSVDPAIRRAVFDHDEGQQVRELVERWYKYVQDLDKSRIGV